MGLASRSSSGSSKRRILKTRSCSLWIGLEATKTKTKAYKSVEWPERVNALRLPPRSPELNPAERWFRELRRHLSNRVFDTIKAIDDALTEALRPYWNDEDLLKRLVGYNWWLNELDNITTLT